MLLRLSEESCVPELAEELLAAEVVEVEVEEESRQ